METPSENPSRPDEHPELVAMGSGEATCDRCQFELYPLAPDSVCDDCKLNPLLRGGSVEQFIGEALARPLSEEELRLRVAMGELATHDNKEEGE